MLSGEIEQNIVGSGTTSGNITQQFFTPEVGKIPANTFVPSISLSKEESQDPQLKLGLGINLPNQDSIQIGYDDDKFGAIYKHTFKKGGLLDRKRS